MNKEEMHAHIAIVSVKQVSDAKNLTQDIAFKWRTTGRKCSIKTLMAEN